MSRENECEGDETERGQDIPLVHKDMKEEFYIRHLDHEPIMLPSGLLQILRRR